MLGFSSIILVLGMSLRFAKSAQKMSLAGVLWSGLEILAFAIIARYYM